MTLTLVEAPTFKPVCAIADTFSGFDVDALRAVYRKVATRGKGVISTTIKESDFDITSAAIAFCAGCDTMITAKYKNGNVRIWAAGYYNTIGC